MYQHRHVMTGPAAVSDSTASRDKAQSDFSLHSIDEPDSVVRVESVFESIPPSSSDDVVRDECIKRILRFCHHIPRCVLYELLLRLESESLALPEQDSIQQNMCEALDKCEDYPCGEEKKSDLSEAGKERPTSSHVEFVSNGENRHRVHEHSKGHALHYIDKNNEAGSLITLRNQDKARQRNILTKDKSFRTIFREDPERFYQETFLDNNDESSVSVISAKCISVKADNKPDIDDIIVDDEKSTSTIRTIGTLADTDGLRRALHLRNTMKAKKDKTNEKRENKSSGKTAQSGFKAEVVKSHATEELPNYSKSVDIASLAVAKSSDVLSTKRKNDLNHSLNESKIENGTRDPSIKVPEYSRHTTALLFVDISGFTKLSTMLDVETLSKTINKYFELIVSEITECGGDILKFAGDALFAEWPVVEKTGQLSEIESKIDWLKTGSFSIEQSLLCAALCGSRIVEKCSDFKVNIPNKENESATLNVHCGVGAGNVVALHVGCDDSKKEFLLLGDPIDQVAKAEETASLGELAASSEAISLLKSTCYLDRSLVSSTGPASIIASRSKRNFQPIDETANNIKSILVGQLSSQLLNERLTLYCKSLSKFQLDILQKRLSAYVHPVVRGGDSEHIFNKFEQGTSPSMLDANEKRKPRANFRTTSVSNLFSFRKVNVSTETSLASSTSCDDLINLESKKKQIRAEAELRSVYVMFIMPDIQSKMTGKKESDEKLFLLLNSVMGIVMRELNRYKGHLRQFIVDDKGVVLIGTFGLRGSAFLNMISKHGLPATVAIHKALSSELNIRNRVGGTIGKTYCGVVGGISQHEYAVLGPSVNLAARLMASPKNPGILVDDAVRMQTTNRYVFKLVSRVMAKGYASLVPIFEPIETSNSKEGKTDYFVGRKNELSNIIGIVDRIVNPDKAGGGARLLHRFTGMRSKRINLIASVQEDTNNSSEAAFAQNFTAKNKPKARMIIILGDSGLGKSSLLFEATQRIQRLWGMNQKQSLVFKVKCNEREQLLPFNTIGEIFKALLFQSKLTISEHSSTSFTGFSSFRNQHSSLGLSPKGNSYASNIHSSSTITSARDKMSKFRASNASMRFSKASMGTYSSRLKNWSNSVHSSISSYSNTESWKIDSSANVSQKPSPQHVSVTSSLVSKVKYLCKVLNRPAELANFICQHVLKDENMLSDDSSLNTSEDDIVSFICEAFVFCTNLDLTLISIDDIHWIDLYSLRTIELLFKNANNLVFISTSRPAEATLNELRKKYQSETRYSEIKLPSMSLKDVRSLCASMISTSEEKIDVTLFTEIYERSGGNPMFAREMIEEIKQLDMLDMNKSGLIIRRENEKELSFKIFEEHYLHKLDTLDYSSRSVLQICAVLGIEFSISDVKRMLPKSENEADELILKAIKNAIGERILTETNEDINASHIESRESVDLIFRFSTSKWLQTVLSTMLDERIRNLHKGFAESLEFEEKSRSLTIMEHLKIFEHWKLNGNRRKTAFRALLICDLYQDWNFFQQCLFLLNDSLIMIRDKIGDLEVDSNNTVIDSTTLQKADPIELELFVRLRLEVGRRLLMQDEWEMAAGSFLRAVAILENCPETIVKFKDTTIFIDAARGMSFLFSENVISIEHSIFVSHILVEIYLSSSKRESDPIHHCVALTFKALAYAHESKFDEAIEIQSKAEQLYRKYDLSTKIVDAYGHDRAAYCASCSVQWYELAGHDNVSIEARIHQVVNDFITSMERSNSNVIIAIPLVMAMMTRSDMVSQAKLVFDDTTEHIFDGSTMSLLKSVQHLLAFAEKITISTGSKVPRIDHQKEVQQWILGESYSFPNAFKIEGASFISELCLYLALSKRKTFKSSSDNRKALVSKGLSLAEHSAATMSTMGGLFAYRSKQMQLVYNKLIPEAPRPISVFSNTSQLSKSDVDTNGGSDQRRFSSRTIPFSEWVGSKVALEESLRISMNSMPINRSAAFRASKLERHRPTSTSDIHDRLPNLSDALYADRYKALGNIDDDSSYD